MQITIRAIKIDDVIGYCIVAQMKVRMVNILLAYRVLQIRRNERGKKKQSWCYGSKKSDRGYWEGNIFS